jgi:hypothetical protein
MTSFGEINTFGLIEISSIQWRTLLLLFLSQCVPLYMHQIGYKINSLIGEKALEAVSLTSNSFSPEHPHAR